jgi:AraC-like DNA-binding protein
MRTKTEDRATHGSNGAESVRIWKARNFIHEHAGEELSLTKVGKATDTSANYLSEKFKEAVGINFVKYVARARYEKAATLVRDTDLRVSEIAFAAGFQSLSQFNRVFKKFSGKSPTEYRAGARQTELARAKRERRWQVRISRN